jgi:hypothetical protein
VTAIVAVLAIAAAAWAHSYHQNRSLVLVSARSWVECTDYKILEGVCAKWQRTVNPVHAPARRVHFHVHPRWADPVGAGLGSIAILGFVFAVIVVATPRR